MTDWLSTGEGRASEAGCLNAGADLIMPGGKNIVHIQPRRKQYGSRSRSSMVLQTFYSEKERNV
jgi:hypothetical protein